MLRFFRQIPFETRLHYVALAQFWINPIIGLARIQNPAKPSVQSLNPKNLRFNTNA